jgi:pilus assembly protein CpaE
VSRIDRKTDKRGALCVLLVGEADEDRTEVRVALASLDDPPLVILEISPGDDASNCGPPPDVVMVLVSTNEEESLKVLQAQSEASPRPVLFALVHERSAVLMRRILRAGADELLFLPLDDGDVTRALLKISETRRRAERQSGGVIVSMVSTVGGVGVTSLAGNLALALRSNFNKRVAAVDLDLQTGGMAVFLNLEVEHTILQLCEGDRRLDSVRLESVLTKHPSGIYLLPAPKRIEDSELVSDKTIGAVLELMRQLFDFVVVDCGGYIDEKTVAAWERSDHLFYLLDQSIGAARSAWRFVELFGRLGLSGVDPNFILSKVVESHPISEEQITRTLGQPIYAKIPYDKKVLDRMQLRAQDLWQAGSGSPLAPAVEELAQRLAVVEGAVMEQSGGLVSRFLSALGARA